MPRANAVKEKPSIKKKHKEGEGGTKLKNKYQALQEARNDEEDGDVSMDMVFMRQV